MLNFYFGLKGRVRRTTAFFGTVALQLLSVLALGLWMNHLGVPLFEDRYNRIITQELRPAIAVYVAVTLWSSFAILWKRVNDIDEDMQGRILYIKGIYPVLAALYAPVVLIGGITVEEFNVDLSGFLLLAMWLFVLHLPPEPGSNEFGPDPRASEALKSDAVVSKSPLEMRMQRFQPAMQTPAASPRMAAPKPHVSRVAHGFGKRTR
ncbi:DUF805 domain-containing protein [Hoeflea sp. TYP-13]|uniref:DUF805 domain-containing protein n=1 Tax=Hoeflea sp. TYP-13 TaxID=3230023 RepID=UPI0034C65E8B